MGDVVIIRALVGSIKEDPREFNMNIKISRSVEKILGSYLSVLGVSETSYDRLIPEV